MHGFIEVTRFDNAIRMLIPLSQIRYVKEGPFHNDAGKLIGNAVVRSIQSANYNECTYTKDMYEDILRATEEASKPPISSVQITNPVRTVGYTPVDEPE